MARPEILKHSVRIDEEEVFRLIGSACELPQIQPSFFGGRVALWAEERERRGDGIKDLVLHTWGMGIERLLYAMRDLMKRAEVNSACIIWHVIVPLDTLTKILQVNSLKK